MTSHFEMCPSTLSLIAIPLVVLTKTCYCWRGDPFFSSEEMRPEQNKTALIIIPDDVSEIEFITMLTILRKAMINVTVAGEFTELKNILTEQDIMIIPDKMVKEAVGPTYDAVIVPGGKGHMYIVQNKLCVKTIKKHLSKGKYVVLMSEAPRILATNRLVHGKRVTCHRSARDDMLKDYKYIDAAKIIADGNLITTPGEAFAIDCGLYLVEKLINEQEAKFVSRRIRYSPYNQ